ncbi:putative ornithine aminotransferase [Mycobacteroides stephanolepidis]|uniref:Putative ornithine aminotransferase n=1 Tax=[Mycobacterium] stephanolepidis TaxID=1520670 RepID=A0A1Z4EXY9_9MYCO|nr:aminotransferase class III-fold pyridoxal phosphate-dependent enzyme [[Mycobacterium] stephanolepidis]BAX97802.1 putative ornithine aminotransferase [[Mycobacterium] stephanolepidis]
MPTLSGTLTHTTTREIADTYRKHLNAGRATLGDVFGGHIETSSTGSWLITASGNRFFNAGGYGVALAGYRHPVIVAHIRQQLDEHPISSRMFYEPVAARAAEALAAITPAGLDRIHFACSGAEATEAAMKIARLNGCRRFISMHGGYHGKTLGALSLTSREVFQAPFRPLLPGVSHVPYGNLEALRAELAMNTTKACVVVEPVQGEAGVIIPPAGYLSGVRALCDQYEALMVADEIQTGLGRLGKWWGINHEQVIPDILLSGKMLGGGVMPVSAAITTTECFRQLDKDPYLHTSTFSSTPLGMAAVCGALTVISTEGLVERAAAIGEEILEGIRSALEPWFESHEVQVRGRGLLIGIAFTDASLVGDLLIELISHGIIVNHSLNSDHVLRLTPPATVDADEINFLLSGFRNAVEQVSRRAKNHPAAQ